MQSKSILTAIALSASAVLFANSALADGKTYNMSPFLPSLQQAKVNGVQAFGAAGGGSSLMPQDCNAPANGTTPADTKAAPGKPGEAAPATNSGIQARNGMLSLGAVQQAQRPREQIIVARDIINVGGQCTIRH